AGMGRRRGKWELGPRGQEVWGGWHVFARARDLRGKAREAEAARWHILRSDDRRRARLNCIGHLLSLIPYKDVPRDKVKLPKRSDKGEYDDQATLAGRHFVPDRS